MPEVLLAAEIALRRLNRGVAQQELNLLDLAAAGVAQLRARSTQVVRRDVLQPCLLGAALDNVPDDILRYAIAPNLVGPRDDAENLPLADSRCRGPVVECDLGPQRNGDRADVPA